jgi:hypothetical protein
MERPPRPRPQIGRRQALLGLAGELGLGVVGLSALSTCRGGCERGEPSRGRPSAAAPSGARSSAARAEPAGSIPARALKLEPASSPSPFAVLEIRGSHRDIGRGMGESFRDSIQALLREQTEFASVVALAGGRLRERVARLEQAARGSHPGLVEELEGMAEGAGMPFAELFAWNCRSEIDAAGAPCPPGCSTVGLVRDGRLLLAHNEDGDEAYGHRMFVLRARPPSGVAFAALVYPGTLPGNGPGLNARGVAQATNYIGPCDAAEGVPRYFVGRAVLEAATLEDAVAIASKDPRAFPWHHNLADLGRGMLVSLETWPGRHHRLDVHGLYLHTNHLLHREMLDLPEQRAYLDRSSLPRLRRLERLFADRPPRSREDVLDALHDRQGTPCKICRRPGDPVGGITVGTAVFESPRPEMSLWDGPSCGGPMQVVSPG